MTLYNMVLFVSIGQLTFIIMLVLTVSNTFVTTFIKLVYVHSTLMLKNTTFENKKG